MAVSRGRRSSLAALAAVMAVLVAASVATAFAATGVVAATAETSEGTMVLRCAFSHFRAADPIVSPGVYPSAHEHAFYGNESTDESSTYASMRASATTCRHSADTAGYWSPSLYRGDGTRVTPLFSFAYYKNLPVNGQATLPFPPNFRMVFGPSGAFWDCFQTGGHYTTSVPRCDGSGNYLVVRLKSPPCWDGRLDSPDHRSHVAYPSGSSCPSSHPLKLATINFFQRYPAGEGGPGYRFSDGAILPHADFWNTWDQSRYELLHARCVAGGVNCGQISG
jgi:hypothetical protein